MSKRGKWWARWRQCLHQVFGIANDCALVCTPALTKAAWEVWQKCDYFLCMMITYSVKSEIDLLVFTIWSECIAQRRTQKVLLQVNSLLTVKFQADVMIFIMPGIFRQTLDANLTPKQLWHALIALNACRSQRHQEWSKWNVRVNNLIFLYLFQTPLPHQWKTLK